MKRNVRRRFSMVLWIFVLVFLVVVLTFPKWITIFYPQPHRDIVVSEAYRNQVDPYLVFAIIRAESKYQTSAQSSAGARGLMQIMPETARWIAEQQGIEALDTDDLHDPDLNIQLGCWYLADLTRQFDGQIPLVIAAYNAGRGKVQEWVADQLWDGSPENLDKIPYPETRDYVRNVLKNYQAYRAIYT